MTLPVVRPVSVTLSNEYQKADCVFCLVDETEIEQKKLLSDGAKKLSEAWDGSLQAVVTLGDFEGKWLQQSSSVVNGKKIIYFGSGKKHHECVAKSRHLGIKISEIISKTKFRNIAVVGTSHYLNDPALTAQLMLGLHIGMHKYPHLNPTLEMREALESSVNFSVAGVHETQAAYAELEPFVAAIRACRLLQDGPPNIVNPDYVASNMATLAQQKGIKTTILNGQQLTEKGFNAMMAVGGGSINDPRLAVFEYDPPHKSTEKTLVFVGKGLTFDTGGYSLKTPSNHQVGMKYDMSGSAIVLSSLLAIADLKLPIKVVAVAALCENMVDGRSYRVDDVIQTYSGKTIEILNTDAEGRVVLCDALAFAAKDLKADYIVEYSTLTGAIITSLGHLAAGVFPFHSEILKDVVLQAAQEAGERVWLMPTFEEVGDDIKGNLADLNNIGATPGAAGSVVGAMFLKEFVESKPYVHIDIAGVANNNMAPGYPAKTGSGYGVQLSVQIAKKLSQVK